MSRPSRIGLIMQGGAEWAGGTEYIRNLVLAFGQLPAAERAGFEICLISATPLASEFARQLEPHLAASYVFSKDSKEAPPETLLNRLRSLVSRRRPRRRPNTHFAKFLATQRFDFLYPLTYDNYYNLGVVFPLGETLGHCRWAGWIPDLQHRCLPELFSEPELARREAGVAALAREAETIVFSSQSAADDFRRSYPETRARTKVLHFHTHPFPEWFAGKPPAVQRQFHLPDEFLLVSNQFWQHKNHTTLFAALALLRERGVQPTLVCTGHTTDFRNLDYFNALLRQIHECGIASQVRILGLVERTEQIQLMRRCVAVVQPSRFEGWSTVLEDARALGKLVIASDIAVHREQNLLGCRFFPTDSPQVLAEVLAEVLSGRAAAGPNQEAETAARATAENAMPTYGRAFLAIVEDCLA